MSYTTKYFAVRTIKNAKVKIEGIEYQLKEYIKNYQEKLNNKKFAFQRYYDSDDTLSNYIQLFMIEETFLSEEFDINLCSENYKEQKKLEYEWWFRV